MEQYGYDRARIDLNRDAVPDVPLHINKENEDVVWPPRPREACVWRRKGRWKESFLFYKVKLFCCIILLFTEMDRTFVNPLVLRIFY